MTIDRIDSPHSLFVDTGMSIASFRDPSGRVFAHKDRIYRAIKKNGVADFEKARNSEVLKRFENAGSLVGATVLGEADRSSITREVGEAIGRDLPAVELLVSHDTLQFQNYPHEWAPEMLHAAGILTLDMMETLISEGMGLKDATPFNIIFRGPEPVFVDWLSFEQRHPSDPIWLAQAQFVRTFVIPLLAAKHYGLTLSQIFSTNREGLEPEAAYKLCGATRKWRSPFLEMVTLPKILGSGKLRQGDIYGDRRSSSPEKAQFILSRQIKYLRRLLDKAAPQADRTSEWSGYAGPDKHFTDEYTEQKLAFVETALSESSPGQLLDIGANTGYYSLIAARSGSSVVSIDLDPTAVGRVWRHAKAKKTDILPLVLNITHPSPALGWRYGECRSFLDRICHQFNGVLMLAVLHHMLVTERIPLEEILHLAADITRNFLILEFVPPSDPMFCQIARGRDHLFEYLTVEYFEAACAREFNLVRYETLADSDRRIYFLRKR